MSALLHHLAQIGFARLVVFVFLDVLAVACAVVATRASHRRTALRAVWISGGATVFSLLATISAVLVGLGQSFAASETSLPANEKARELAIGISLAMNGGVFGAFFTTLAAIASVVCLTAAIALRPKPPVP